MSTDKELLSDPTLLLAATHITYCCLCDIRLRWLEYIHLIMPCCAKQLIQMLIVVERPHISFACYVVELTWVMPRIRAFATQFGACGCLHISCLISCLSLQASPDVRLSPERRMAYLALSKHHSDKFTRLKRSVSVFEVFLSAFRWESVI